MHAVLWLFCAAPSLDYRVTVAPGAETLDVEVRGAAGELTIDPPLRPFVLPQTDAGTVFKYRFRLKDAATTLASRNWAFVDGKGIYAPPSSWLMRPASSAPDARFSLQVSGGGDFTFVTGLHRTDAGYVGPQWVLADAPWGGFAPFIRFVDEVAGAEVETAIAPGALALTPAQVRAWVLRSVKLVAQLFGRFPVSRVAVMVLPQLGDSVGFGTAMGNGGAAVLVWLGEGADEETVMRRDWVLPHELAHFGVPNLPRYAAWFEEGAATYLEPLARVRAQELSVDDFWRQMLEKLPLGQPDKGDRGLDRTPTWARTYWGGALFLFAADVELRSQGKSLEQALQGVVAAGGNQEVRWSLEQTLAAADTATGLKVLTRLHAKLGAAPGTVNLAGLFQKLGVSLKGSQVRYDDAAPWANLRKAMTAPAQ